VPPVSSSHFLYPKNGGRKFSEMFVPIYTQLNGVQIQKTVVIKRITLRNSNIASNLKNKTDGVFA